LTGRSPLVVLHVVESYGAGTASALDQYVRATPDLEHHLVRRYRPDDDHADDGEQRRFATVGDLGPGVRPALASVRRRVADLRPDVVHGHSSFGGAFARLAAGSRGDRPLVVHTPHCYATERRDVSAPARLAYAAVERVLGARTDVVAGCSEREVALARRFAPRARHRWVVNVTDPVDVPADATRAGVVGVGRITAQRDPELFAAVVTRLRASSTDLADLPATWVGGGDDDGIALLRSAGVEVTGWLPRSAALARLTTAALYVHTAQWDGAPMTLAEAYAAGAPIVARRTPAVTGPLGWVADDADGLAERGRAVLSDPARAAACRAGWTVRFADHTVERQRADLLAAYGIDDVDGTRR
jgi:glycosyltransferase involved in cell wall biosynthesis